MKVAILNNGVPFLRGGAEHLADALAAKLIEYGHRAMVVRIPFSWDNGSQILEHMVACRLMRMPLVDRVIALKFPAYYVPHENKYIWLLHQFRQVYDLWGSAFQGLPDTPDTREVRNTILRADTAYLSEAKKIFTNSSVTSGRLKAFNGLGSEVLYPPLLSVDQFECKEYGDFVLALGRVNELKRQLLLVEALQYCKTPVKLVVAGKPETEAYAQSIAQAIENRGLRNRVEFVARFVDEEEKKDLLSRALAVAYIPFDEDSYGYVTLEAFLSMKPVITCEDSGGILEFVNDRITGRVCKPDPEYIAEAFDSVFEAKAIARALGEAGRALVDKLDIRWDRVIEKLTS